MFNATKQPAGCPQRCDLPPHTCPPSLSEDCLYLNVYTPRLSSHGLRGPSAEGHSPWAVMLFIHGVRRHRTVAPPGLASPRRRPPPAAQGRFEQGGIDTELYDSRFLAGKFGVMVVTIQYRCAERSRALVPAVC